MKISPDISFQQLDDILSIIEDTSMFGIIATNTTLSRERLQTKESQVLSVGSGGLSGKPLFEKSTAFVKYIRQNTTLSFPIIASGGIFSGDDALIMVKNGANLLQVWTGFVYKGPNIVKEICDSIRKY